MSLEGEIQFSSAYDIIKNSGWVNFELSPNTRILVQTSQYDGSFWIVSLVEQKVLEIKNLNKSVIDFVAFTPDNKCFFTRSKTETIIWDIRNE